MSRCTIRKTLAISTLVACLSLTSYVPRPQAGAYQASVPLSKLEATVTPQAVSQASPDITLLFFCGLGLAAASTFYRRKLY